MSSNHKFIIHTNCENTGLTNVAPYDKDLVGVFEDLQGFDECILKNAQEKFGTTDDIPLTFSRINTTLELLDNRILKKQGGNAVVYFKKDFALRILLPHRLHNADDEYRAGFIQTFISNQCESIPKIYAIGMYDGDRPFQLMENVGKDLGRLIDSPLKRIFGMELTNKKIKVDNLLNCVESVECMHKNNFVHRDIKPDNITVKDGTSYLIDFGYSNHESHIVQERLGTPAFIPNELYFHKNTRLELQFLKQCDIYMLALTMLFVEYPDMWVKIKNIMEEEFQDKNRLIVKYFQDIYLKIPSEASTWLAIKKSAKYLKYLHPLNPKIHTIENFMEDFFPSEKTGGKRQHKRKNRKTTCKPSKNRRKSKRIPR
jgi:serine/threonine protein kinase